VTDTTLVSGVFLTPGVALAIVDAFAKFKERAHRGKRSGDPYHAPFEKNFFTLGWDFKECSFIHFRNIDGGLKF